MALDKTRLQNALGPAIESQIRGALALGVVPYPQLTSFAAALGAAIADKVVDEIKNNAVVSATVTGSATGAMSPYDVTGTATGAIT